MDLLRNFDWLCIEKGVGGETHREIHIGKWVGAKEKTLSQF
jgi:hypothetical protein